MGFLDVFRRWSEWNWAQSEEVENTPVKQQIEIPINTQVPQKVTLTKIPILINSRVTKEQLPKETWKQMNSVIAEKMSYFVHLPYQICDCSYIGDGKAWAEYNWNNKRTLEIAINQINYFLSDVCNLSDNIQDLVRTDYHINFKDIYFEYVSPIKIDDLPQSYIIYVPETKTGKRSQYPLIAFFNTSKGNVSTYDEFYAGELYYAINGDLARALVHCHKGGMFAEFTMSVVGRTFLVSRIRRIGKDGKLFTAYDCEWEFTDYIDFA